MSTLTSEICPFCGSSQLIRQINTDKPNLHYGSLTCGDCSRHLRWLPSPSVDALYQERQIAIDEALAGNRVVGWERYFLTCIRGRRHLSPKQFEKFQQILANQKPQPGRGKGVMIA